MLLFASCERDLEELQPATFPTDGDVFIDGFTGGLQYAVFAGAKPTAFDVDTETKYKGTTSMKFSVPDAGDALGSYAGGTFFLESGRDLSGYNALTFWAKATKAANIDVLGFANDLGANVYQTSISGVPVNTDWKKYYIPIPDPAKLTMEKGMLYFSEAPENDRGYTFWLDEVKFENVGTVVKLSSLIFGGEDRQESVESGATFTATGTAIYNLPDGTNQIVTVSSSSFAYTSSNPDVATVSEAGVVTVVGEGTAVITATLGGDEVVGSLTIGGSGIAIRPSTAAPTPDKDATADNVISIFSDQYEDETIDFYNGFWTDSDTQSEIIQVSGDDIIRYSQLNFVGTEFKNPTIDATGVNRMHIDIWTPDDIDEQADFTVKLVDFGSNNQFGGGDDAEASIIVKAPTLKSREWISVDVPLADFSGLSSRANLAQIVYVADGIPNTVFVDNVYFYSGEDGGGGGGGDGTAPNMAAPTPTKDAAQVISLFSEAYEDVPVDNWRAGFSEADFSDVMVAGDAAKRYDNLDFVGIETIMNQIDVTEMTHFSIDVWSAGFTSFIVKLVDAGADRILGNDNVADDTESFVIFDTPAQAQWVTLDIPLGDFASLMGLKNIAQLIVEATPRGEVTAFIDNVYFYKDEGGGGGGGGDGGPSTAAPTPTTPTTDVISLFSDAYDDVAVETWRTDWSTAEFSDVMVAGDAVKKYSALDFVGITTEANQLDLSEMTHIRLDVWSADFTSFSVKLVDFGANGIGEQTLGDDAEHQIDFAMPATGEWISYDIPLSDFTGLTTKKNIAQYILVAKPAGAATVYIDNMYFRK
ncbi:Ig-like domain-containing protein [Neolewinella antarctica]|nr:Ig-like domain-containing protein [Neolewinella antarctica]